MSIRRPPNILFLFTDDQRFDTIGALGNPGVPGAAAVATPNLDRIVERGTAFTHAHIPGGTSDAVCMPSRAMLHTGRNLFHIEGAGEEIPRAHTLLGEHLARHGYQTWGTGKWHNGSASFNRSFQGGSSIFFGGMQDHWNVPAFDYDPSGAYPGTLPQVPNWYWSNEVSERQGDWIRAGVHSSQLFCDAAVERLEEQDADVPFFMYVSFMAPHDPRTMPAEYLRRYDAEQVALPPNFAPRHPFDNGALDDRDEMLAAHPREEAEVRRHIAEYYAMIAHLDAEIGRVLDALERRGLAGDTIVVLAGDNGLAVGQHGLMGKQNLYEHSVRVPLVFAGPGVPRGERRAAPAYLLDIFPTLCELAELPTPDTVQGRSLVPALASATWQPREQLYLAFLDMQRAIKDGRYKLIEYALEGSAATQLFDLQEDPWEMRNLADDPAHRERLAAMRSQLAAAGDASGEMDTPFGPPFWNRLPPQSRPASATTRL